jgi:hypothetical protein
MSLSKPQSSPFEILPDLHHEPRVRYPAWKAAIFELAILQCQTQHVSGLWVPFYGPDGCRV